MIRPSWLCADQFETSTSPPPRGIPRAFDCASCPGKGEFKCCVWRVGNLNRIYFLFWCNTHMRFVSFFRLWWIYKTEFPLCHWIALSKGSLKEDWRCHYWIFLSERHVKCLIEDQICLWGEAAQYLLNGFRAPSGGNLNKPIFKSSNARGVARGG